MMKRTKFTAIGACLLLGACNGLGGNMDERLNTMQATIDAQQEEIERLKMFGSSAAQEHSMIGAEIASLRQKAELLDELHARLDEAERMGVMSGGTYAVHLASYRNTPTATAGWHDLLARYSDQLVGLKGILSVYSPPGSDSQFYRLKAGPIATEEMAKELCQALEALGEYCAVDTFDGELVE